MSYKEEGDYYKIAEYHDYFVFYVLFVVKLRWIHCSHDQPSRIDCDKTDTSESTIQPWYNVYQWAWMWLVQQHVNLWHKKGRRERYVSYFGINTEQPKGYDQSLTVLTWRACWRWPDQLMTIWSNKYTASLLPPTGSSCYYCWLGYWKLLLQLLEIANNRQLLLLLRCLGYLHMLLGLLDTLSWATWICQQHAVLTIAAT